MLGSLRRLLVAGAAVLAAGAVAVPAQAAAPAAPAGAVPAQAGHALVKPAGKSTAHVMPRAGSKAMPVLGASTSQAASAGLLTNGSGNLTYNNGFVQTAPRFFLDFWGSQWTSGGTDGTNTDAQGQNYVTTFVNDLAGSPYLNSQTQFCQSSSPDPFGGAVPFGAGISSCGGNPHAGLPGTLAGVWNDNAAAAATPTLEQDIVNEAEAARAHFQVAAQDQNSLFIVLSPPDASAFTLQDVNGAFCAFHDWDVDAVQHTLSTVFAYVPWTADQGAGCGTNLVNPVSANDTFGHGHLDGMSIATGHEIAETVTDPLVGAVVVDNQNVQHPFFGWVDAQGFETGDKCVNLPKPAAWPEENQTLGGDFFAVQPLWTDAGASCTMQDLGGIISGHAAITARDANHRDVFVRGGDGQVYWKTATGDNWSGWNSLGGSTPSSPAAVSWDANRIDLFVRGGDNQLWHKAWTPAGWAANWDGLGGFITGGPAVSSWAANRLDVFVRGGDNQLWHKSWNGSAWSGYDGQGGTLTADPAAVSWAPNRIDVFVRGGDNAMWHKSWNGSVWSGYDGLGGSFISGFGAASTGTGELQVFGIGGDHVVYRKTFSGAWGGFQSLEGSWPTDPAAISPPSSGTRLIELFMLGNTTTSIERLILGI